MRLLFLAPLLSIATLSLGQSIDLRKAVELAEANRPSIQAARLRLIEAKANQSALSVYSPTRLEFGGGTNPGFGSGEDLLLAIPVDVFGKASAGRATGRAAVIAAQAALLQAELDLQTEVINAFADARSAQDLVATGTDLESIAQQVYDSAAKRVKAGDLAPAELLRLDLELQRAKQTVALRRLTLKASTARLSGALGLAGQPFNIFIGDAPTVPQNLDTSRRPDLLEIRSEVASAEADARTARLGQVPDLELQFRRAPFDQPEQYGARVQVVWPLLDYNASGNRLRAARAARDAARRSLADRVQTSLREAEAALAELQGAKDAAQGFERLIEDAKSILQKQQHAYSAGAGTLLDVLEATRAVREIEESAADARLRWLQAEGRYLASTGSLLPQLP